MPKAQRFHVPLNENNPTYVLILIESQLQKEIK